jgi:quaternary ammonium compound-resistance protein SugE
MAWLVLFLAGLCEIGFTTCLRFADNFRNLPWTAGFLVFASASFFLLDQAAKAIPLGTAYAVWVGIGAAGTLIVGVATGQEALGLARLMLLVLLVGSIIGLKLTHP